MTCKMRGEGLEKMHRRWSGERKMGNGSFAFLGGSPCLQQDRKLNLKLQETCHITHTRLPWHPSWSTRGQTTQMTDKPSHGTHLKVYRETDYTNTYKAPARDRLHQPTPTTFLWGPSYSTPVCRNIGKSKNFNNSCVCDNLSYAKWSPARC